MDNERQLMSFMENAQGQQIHRVDVSSWLVSRWIVAHVVLNNVTSSGIVITILQTPQPLIMAQRSSSSPQPLPPPTIHIYVLHPKKLPLGPHKPFVPLKKFLHHVLVPGCQLFRIYIFVHPNVSQGINFLVDVVVVQVYLDSHETTYTS